MSVTVKIRCRVCGRLCDSIHDAGCWECHPEVPADTPNSREVVWTAWLSNGSETGRAAVGEE
jgi:hypothetical protein